MTNLLIAYSIWASSGLVAGACVPRAAQARDWFMWASLGWVLVLAGLLGAFVQSGFSQ